MLRGYGQRWTGTETLHRDGKQHLGLGDCQLRNGEGQTRHMYLVLLAHSLLMAQLRQGRVSAWANETLMEAKPVGQCCAKRWGKRSAGRWSVRPSMVGSRPESWLI